MLVIGFQNWDEIVADLKQRAAELNDLKDIWGLLRQTANDIPFDLESEADQEMY